MDEDVKRNQTYIKETVAAYSGGIVVPKNVVKKKMVLSDYYMGAGVCKSLSTYFNSLTANYLQELSLTGNGLKDASMATLLRGLTDQRALRSIHYGDNEFGK